MRSNLIQRHSWTKVVISLVLASLTLTGGWWLLATPTVAQGGRPSSLELIEDAYLRGELDYETALVYKVYSVFAPDRLPVEFQSDTPSRGATLVVAEVMNAWDSLSMETKILLREFGLGVPLPGEVVPLAQSRPTINGEEIYDTTHFRIHYTQLDGDADEIPSDDDNANGTPDYLEWVAEAVENVWDTEITTMGWLQPPPDTGEGGDTRYDVYLKNCWPYYGYVNYSDGFVGDNPNSPAVTETDAYYSYMVLENDFKLQSSPQNDIKVTVAHEFNHAIQVGYDGTEETWLMESTATWIEDEVYDDINDNYQFLDKLFQEPDMALDTAFTSYAYSRWIFMRYISEHYGQTTVRRIWEHAVTQDNMDTVELALLEAGTDFATLFPRFAAANYVLSDLAPNAPYDYEEADGYKGAISGGAIETEAIIPFNGTSLTYNSFTDGNGRLEHRSAEYIEVESTVNFQVTFESYDSTDFMVQGALRHPDGRVTIKQVSLSGGQGTWVVTDPATYDEVVVVVTNRGDTDETAGYDLTFQATSETPPTASFTTSPISGTTDTVFNFDASASTDTQTPASQLEVRWDWDGDWVWDTDWSTTKTATHSYTAPGTYTVTVEVRDAVDLRDTASQVITVNNTSPTASFTVQPTEGTVNTDFAFDASGCSDLETPLAQLEVRWDWEADGNYDTGWSTSKTTAHSYGQPDTYTVRLQVRDEDGLTDTSTQTLTVNNTPPTAAFSIDSTVGTTETVFGFDATSSSDLETPLADLEVRWDWETDATFDTAWSTAKTITHSYDALGVYTITMEIRDTGGLTDTAAHTVTVQALGEPPTASFTVSPTQGTMDVAFEFDASGSTDAQTPAAQLEVRWDWENDGYFDTSWSTTKVLTHIFDQPAVYVVALEVKDGDDLTDLTTHTVTVVNTAPTAAFSVDPGSGSIYTNFAFDASGSSDNETPLADLEVHWDWEGDGQYDTVWSTTKTATHTFDLTGTYTVTLEVRDGQGLTSTATHALVVTEDAPPTAVLTIQPSEGITNTEFVFDASGSSDDLTPQSNLEVRWDWENDGVFDTGWSSDKTATHVFPIPDTYVVAVEVRDSQQQTDVARRAVVVHDEQWLNNQYWVYIPIVLKSYSSN